MCSCVFLGLFMVSFLNESRGAVHSGLGSGVSLFTSLSSSLSPPPPLLRGMVRRVVKGRSPRLKERKEFINEKKKKKKKPKEDISNVFFELKCNVYKEM